MGIFFLLGTVFSYGAPWFRGVRYVYQIIIGIWTVFGTQIKSVVFNMGCVDNKKSI